MIQNKKRSTPIPTQNFQIIFFLRKIAKKNCVWGSDELGCAPLKRVVIVPLCISWRLYVQVRPRNPMLLSNVHSRHASLNILFHSNYFTYKIKHSFYSVNIQITPHLKFIFPTASNNENSTNHHYIFFFYE